MPAVFHSGKSSASCNNRAMSRRLLLRFALLTAILVAAVLWPRPSAITRENQAKVHEGMTRDEFEAILGGPPRDESSGPTEYDPNGPTPVPGRRV